jgi:oligopeptide transport system substrate-binding protein
VSRQAVPTTRRIPGGEWALLAQRLAGVGVGRRDFLKLAAGLAALGTGAFRAGPAAAARALEPDETLAAEQVFRFGGGGWYQHDPSSHDFNKDVYCQGVPELFAGLMKFDADLRAIPYVATEVTPNRDYSVWTFTLRRDARWSDGSPCTARDFEYSWKRQLDPATAAPYASFLYDIKNGEAFNTGRVTNPGQVGVRARGDWTLEVTLEGPRSYFPVLTAYQAALPGHRASIEKHGDKWTEPGNIVCNGPFVLESWQHGTQLVLRKNPQFFGAEDVILEKVVIPIIRVGAGAQPYTRNFVDATQLQTASLRLFRASAQVSREVFRFSSPGTWYLTPQVTNPPFDDVRVRRAVAHAVDREDVASTAHGFAIPAHSMIPPGYPGALDDPKTRDLQRFDPELAMSLLRGTPYEGGHNWPKIVLAMRDEGLGSKSLARTVQGVLFQYLNMRIQLKILDPRMFRERLWNQDFQLVWIRWLMDYPDPHNEYFDPFYGKKITGVRQAWRNEAFDREVEAARGALDPKERLEHYARAEEILQTDVGYIPVAWMAGYAAIRPWVRGFETNRAGEKMVDGNIYVDMLAHLYIVKKAPR